jgi:hypothetical protein
VVVALVMDSLMVDRIDGVDGGNILGTSVACIGYDRVDRVVM